MRKLNLYLKEDTLNHQFVHLKKQKSPFKDYYREKQQEAASTVLKQASLANAVAVVKDTFPFEYLTFGNQMRGNVEYELQQIEKQKEIEYKPVYDSTSFKIPEEHRDKINKWLEYDSRMRIEGNITRSRCLFLIGPTQHARAEGELERTEISLVQCQHDFDVAMQTKQIGEQNLQGLPNDDLSIQNGIIATSNYRYPLLIDPQLQGKSWIKDMERDHDLVITTLNSKLFRQQLDDSIAFGRPLLIEDVKEELDPILDPILEKNFSKLDRTLRLYITTKLANPTYAPEICARVSVIDFTVTQRGLEHQLLSLLIANERNELERERVTLARETTKNKRMLKELEDNLLIKLTSSLLDDPSVVEVLNANKRIATEVKEKVVIAEETKMKISTARE
ncbi:unnamed protein product [Rotaria socialis]